MPSNMRQFKKYLEREINEHVAVYNKEVQQTAARIILQELAKGTPVDTGRLAANWELVKEGNTSTYKHNSFLQTHRVSAIQEKRIEAITGKFEFSITNITPYILEVNNGIGGNLHNKKFFQLSLLAARARLQPLGITLNF